MWGRLYSLSFMSREEIGSGVSTNITICHCFSFTCRETSAPTEIQKTSLTLWLWAVSAASKYTVSKNECTKTSMFSKWIQKICYEPLFRWISQTTKPRFGYIDERGACDTMREYKLPLPTRYVSHSVLLYYPAVRKDCTLITWLFPLQEAAFVSKIRKDTLMKLKFQAKYKCARFY